MRFGILLAILVFAVSACDKKTAEPTAPAPTAEDAPKAPVAKADPAPAPAPAAAPAGDAPSNDKEMLGLDLKPFGAWKPAWDPDAKVAKWENEDVFTPDHVRHGHHQAGRRHEGLRVHRDEEVEAAVSRLYRRTAGGRFSCSVSH